MAEASKNLLPDVKNMANWTIVVVLTSYDGFGPARVRPVSPIGGEWVINGTAYALPDMVKRIAQAIVKGVEPRIMDLLVYSADYPNGISAKEQYSWLDSYNADLGLPAFIPGVVLKPTTITETQTVVKTTTIVNILTATTTIEKKVTTVSPTTVTKTVADWATASVLGIILLIIGFVVGYVVKVKKK